MATTYEYTTITRDPTAGAAMFQQINELGAQGWRMVPLDHPGLVWFEREIMGAAAPAAPVVVRKKTTVTSTKKKKKK